MKTLSFWFDYVLEHLVIIKGFYWIRTKWLIVYIIGENRVYVKGCQFVSSSKLFIIF